MAVGDIAAVPVGGISLEFAPGAVCGSTTTMYVGTVGGYIKSLTTAGVLADLTTKVRLPGRIATIVLSAYTYPIIAILEDGDVYAVATDGSTKTKICSLGARCRAAYYYSNYVYCILDGQDNRLDSSLVSIHLA